MSRYLTSILFCEGREDGAFLARVLGRQLEDWSLSGDFDFGPITVDACRTVARGESLDAAVLAAAPDFDLLLIHNDHNERGKIDALEERVGDRLPQWSRLVRIVPVRETEAWVLADPSVFRGGASTNGLPSRPRDVEGVPDPKALIKQVLDNAYDEPTAEAFAERIDLSKLAQVPAYDRFLQELATALKELRFL